MNNLLSFAQDLHRKSKLEFLALYICNANSEINFLFSTLFFGKLMFWHKLTGGGGGTKTYQRPVLVK